MMAKYIHLCFIIHYNQAVIHDYFQPVLARTLISKGQEVWQSNLILAGQVVPNSPWKPPAVEKIPSQKDNFSKGGEAT